MFRRAERILEIDDTFSTGGVEEKNDNAPAHRATTPKGEGIAGEAELLETRHRHELGRLQTRQPILPDVESSEASHSLEDRRLDQRDKVVREIQLLQRQQIEEPLILHPRDVVVRQTELLQVRQAFEGVIGDRLDAAVLHIQGDQASTVSRERPLGNVLYPRFEDHDVAYVQGRAVIYGGVHSHVGASQPLQGSCA